MKPPDELTFYSFYENYKNYKIQVNVTVNFRNKTMEVHRNNGNRIVSKHGYSCFELQDGGEVERIIEVLKYKGYKEVNIE